jgi:acyl carrier protein
MTNGRTKPIRQFVFEKFPLARQRSISDTDPLIDSGIIDSLGVLDLVAFLEAEFGICVADEDLVPDHFQSISCLAAFVQSKLQ